MTNLSRVTAKIFGETASATGDDPEIGQFGSALAGTYVGTNDVATIQGLSAWSNGFIDSVTPSTQFPPLPEMTGFGKVLSYQTAYTMQKGVPEWDANTVYYTGDFCKGVGEGKLYVSLIDNNLNHAVSDTAYWEEFSSGAFRNIGEIVSSTIPLTDAGLHLLDGALISGSGSYADFVTYIASIYNLSLNYFCSEADWQASVSTYGSCGKFVYDSVNNTVRLPKINNILQATTDVTKLGDLVEAGLPNITGTFRGINYGDASGAFTLQSSNYGYANFNAHNGDVTKWTFNASRSSSIYGNSNTVQPQTIKVLYYIVIATSTKTAIQVDIDEIATDLNGKADVDLSNTNDTAKILMSGMGMPSSTYETLTVGSTGTTYTAPSNGYYVITGTPPNTNTGGDVRLTNVTGKISMVSTNIWGREMATCIAVRKGDMVQIQYSDSSNTALTFIYAKGSESEAS